MDWLNHQFEDDSHLYDVAQIQLPWLTASQFQAYAGVGRWALRRFIKKAAHPNDVRTGPSGRLFVREGCRTAAREFALKTGKTGVVGERRVARKKDDSWWLVYDMPWIPQDNWFLDPGVVVPVKKKDGKWSFWQVAGLPTSLKLLGRVRAEVWLPVRWCSEPLIYLIRGRSPILGIGLSDEEVAAVCRKE